MNPSIRHRLLISLLSITLIIWVVTALKSYVDTRYEVQELSDAQLAQSARALLALSIQELHDPQAFLFHRDDQGHSVPELTITNIHKYEQQLAFQIWSSDGNLRVHSNAAPHVPLSEIDGGFSNRTLDNQSWRVYAMWNRQHTVQVQVGEHYEQRDELSNDIALHILTSLILTLPVLALLIWFGVGRAMAPLQRIANDMQSRELDNLHPVDSKRVPLEAKSLVDALNELFHRLQVAFNNIRRFTADAAHELRTPLAALKTHAQVAYRATDDESRNEALQQVIEGVDRATHLVEQLLTLARLDPESDLVKQERTDLCMLTEEKLADIAPLALEKHIDLSFYPCPQGMVLGQQSMLSILVRNLVENAIRYTPEGGRIEVNIKRIHDKVVFSVADSGPGIPPEERKLVFKRFYRHLGNNVTGTGLGLSIVKRIAEILHADITLGESEYHGLQVEIGLQGTSSVSNKSPQRKAASF